MSPRIVQVETEPPYAVHVGAELLPRVHEALDGARAALVADARAAALHAQRLGPLVDAPRLELPGGEPTKSLARLGQVLDFLAASDLDRHACVVVLGGGVLGDLGGLAAALYLRGVAWIQVPTTLLAQVDASVGGKTAIDLAAGKNLAGAFHQPRAVFADGATLTTLDEDDYRAGLGEVVKTALVAGEALLARLEALAAELAARTPAALEEVVAACVATKAAVVASDPLERGPRRVLNLGHTFAHAIEHAAGYGTVSHGVAVAAGLDLALEASERLGVLEDAGLRARVRGLLEALGLPSGLAELRARHALALPAEALLEGLALDKKRAAGRIELVLPHAAGRVGAGVAVERAWLGELFA